MKMKRSSILSSPEAGGSTKRRRRLSISEDESLASCSKSSDSPPMSKIYNSTCRNNKPAELFRKDLISAMKLPDNEQLDENDFWYVTDTWKQEWERGVQVPVNSKNAPFPQIKEIKRKAQQNTFKMPKKIIRMTQDEFYSADTHVMSTALQDSEKTCRYDLDDLDLNWLNLMNKNRSDWGLSAITEDMFELMMEDLEVQCFNKFQDALKTEEGLGIEYDDDVICDVCRNPECEEGNEMVFCDICNICVHQACYGITAIPEGSWVCRTCAANVQPSCVLCPNKGGAMKSTRTGNKWAHVSCALWVPEVQIVDPEKMEPINRIAEIPPSRWALICTFCRERIGACIQCCVKQCKVAYHVTCAFENGLEMSAVYDESNEDIGVKLRSFCSKHAYQNRENEPDGMVWRMKTSKKENKASKVSDLEKHNARLQKIREMEAEFYKYINVKQVKVPHADKEAVDFIFMYWKLKRTANYNKPLLCTKLDESALLGKQPEDSLYARMKMFVHLRQDLERVRNLCYMVSRREKLRRTFIKSQEEIFLQQVDALGECSKKQHPKEHESILASSFGETIYDKIYFGAAYKPPDRPVNNTKEPESEKKKLVSASRLPNPYAKLYFSSIHTRSRGHSSTSTSPVKGSTEKSSEEATSNADSAQQTASPIEKARRSSVPTIAVAKVEPKLRERRISANFSDRSRNEESGGSGTTIFKNKPCNVEVVKKVEEDDVEIGTTDKNNTVEMKEKDNEIVTRKRERDNAMEIKRKDAATEVKRKEKDTTVEVKRKEKDTTVEVKKKEKDTTVEVKKKDKDTNEAKRKEKDATVEVKKEKDATVEVKKKEKDVTIEVKKKEKETTVEVKKKEKDATVEIKNERDATVEGKKKEKDTCVEVKKKDKDHTIETRKRDKDTVVELTKKEKDHEKMELRGQSFDKENVPAVCSDIQKTESIIDTSSLCDVKNSPSQSDKENISAKPKMRGRRPKSQVDVKALELSLTVKENHVISSEKLNKIDNLSHVSTSEALKTSNARTSRYEMRSRNNSTSLSQDETTPIEVMDKTLLMKEEIPTKCIPPDDVIDAVESGIAKEKEFPHQKKVRLKSVRRTRCRLFNTPSKDKCSESLRTISSSESSSDDSFDEQDQIEHTEYKMTLRQNGKVVLSPLRKNDAQDSASPRDPSTFDASPKNSVVQRNCSIPDEVNSESGDSQHASTSSRDATSSPRIILKLVKDRDRQQWQKHSSSCDQQPSTFKVIRNDWELTSDNKNFNEFELLSEFGSGHRYMMRSRSKQNS